MHTLHAPDITGEGRPGERHVRLVLARLEAVVSGIRDPFSSSGWDKLMADPPEPRPTAKRTRAGQVFELEAEPSPNGRRTRLRVKSATARERLALRRGDRWIVQVGDDVVIEAVALTSRLLEARARFGVFAEVDTIRIRRAA